ncbi:MAG: RNA 3'-terminal phosphate cyclase [Candidatus Nanoarchaeia archaeon]
MTTRDTTNTPLIDLCKYNDETSMISHALSLSLVTKEPFCAVFINENSSGLTTFQQQLILFIASLCDAKVSGVTKGSKEFFFIPQNYFEKKKIDAKEAFSQPQHSTQIIKCLLPLLLTSGKKITCHLHSSTYNKNMMSLQMFKETILRFTNPLMVKNSVHVLQESIYPQQSTCELTIQSKHDLFHAPPLKIKKQAELISLKSNCLFAQEYTQEHEREHIRKTISISMQQKNIPFDCNTRTQELEKPTFWISNYALFGNEEGFDNDNAGVMFLEKEFEINPYIDEEVIKFNKLCSEKMNTQKISSDLLSFLLPIITCIGGEIPKISKECKEYKTISYIAQKILDVTITTKENSFFCQGYTSKHIQNTQNENVIAIDELE